MRKILSLLSLLFLALASPAWGKVEIQTLRVEHATDPLGIDTLQPRLSWILTSQQHDQSQSAYRVLVASSREKLDADQGDLWDSGKVTSNQSVLVPYAGKPLTSSEPCFWKVKMWDQSGTDSGWSKPGTWTMGLLQPGDWQGKWIGYNPTFPRRLPATGVLSKMNWDGVNWMWTGEGDATKSIPAGRTYFQWNVAIPTRSPIRIAYLRADANDFLAYVNTTATQVTEGNDWHHPAEVEITNFLKPGRNRIGMEVNNKTAGPCAWACKLAVEFEDGSHIELSPSDKDTVWTSTKLTPEQKAKWLAPGMVTDFKPAKVVGPVGIEPWGKPEYGYLPGWNMTAPEALLRKGFTLDKPLKRAVLFASGLGCADLFCNGRKIGDEVLDPAFSQYDQTVLYTTHDITSQLQQGKNALGAMLGNGWYNMTTLTIWDFHNASWRDRPKLLLQLRLEYADGSVQNIVSDGTWKAAPGPILADSFHNGEFHDANAEIAGWNTATFDDSKWAAAEVMAAPKGTLKAQMMRPMRITQTIKPVKITEPQPGIYVFDLGQNFAGHARIRVNGPKGTQISLIYSEKVKDNGLMDRILAGLTFSGSWQQDEYVLKGDGPEEWEAQFAYHGFRYVEVHGFPGKPTLDSLDGRVVHTDFEKAGEFECSDPLINAIQQSTLWSYRSNFQGFPTDCPTREKKGWLGDAHLPTEQAMWNFDNAEGYANWLRSFRDVQGDDGHLKAIIPTGVWGGEELDWNVAVILIPWTVYTYTGDTRILADNYDAMKRWFEYYQVKQPGNIVPNGVGDWVPPFTQTPHEVTSTCYYYTGAKLLGSIAALLGKPEEAAHFTKAAEAIRDAFDKKFLQPDGTVANGSQSSQVCALWHGLIPPDKKQAVLRKLLEKIHAADDHHDTGYLGAKAIYRELSDDGYVDLAYKMTTQKTMPGYGYWISEGFTTLNEMWPGGKKAGRGGSNNHIAFGDISAWFYQYLAGINTDPEKPEFKHIIFRPRPVGELTWVKAWHESPYGIVGSSWRRTGDKFEYDVTIPVNTTATVWVPSTGSSLQLDGKPYDKVASKEGCLMAELGSGTYHFTSAWAPRK